MTVCVLDREHNSAMLSYRSRAAGVLNSRVRSFRSERRVVSFSGVIHSLDVTHMSFTAKRNIYKMRRKTKEILLLYLLDKGKLQHKRKMHLDRIMRKMS